MVQTEDLMVSHFDPVGMSNLLRHLHLRSLFQKVAVGLHHHSALFCVFGNQARRQLGADAGSHSRSCVSIVHSVVGNGGDEEQPPEEEGEPLSHETAIMGLIIVSCFFQLPFSFIAVASSSTIFKDQQ